MKGLICLHKPSGMQLHELLEQVDKKVLKEMNDFNPEYDDRLANFEEIQKHGGLIDYSSHPHVLGDTFHNEDLEFEPVNDPGTFTSGLCLVSLNDHVIWDQLNNVILPRQYLLNIELGKATDNSFCHGKIREKSTYEHLKNRPQILEKALATIRSSHQRDAFRQAGVNLQSQQAYEMAVKGLIRPVKEHRGACLIYGLNCVLFKPPLITLRVTCINESPIYLAEFSAELGLKLRTNAVLNSLQLVTYGPFTSENSLLLKHVNVENVIRNINQNFVHLDYIQKHYETNLI